MTSSPNGCGSTRKQSKDGRLHLCLRTLVKQKSSDKFLLYYVATMTRLLLLCLQQLLTSSSRKAGASMFLSKVTHSHAPSLPTSLFMELLGLRPASVDGSEDNGPFYDLEFASALVEEDGLRWSDSHKRNAGAAAQLELSSSCSFRRDLALSFSTSEGLCFRGHLVTVDASKSSSRPQVPAFLLKLRALKSWFHRRSKSTSLEINPGGSPRSPSLNNFLFKFKVDDLQPRQSLLDRDNSWRSSSRRSAATSPAGSNEKKLTSDILQRYLSKIKPLYMKISKRYGEKLRQFTVAPSSIGGDAKVRPGAGEGGGDQTKHQSSFVSSRLRKNRSTSATASVSSQLATARRRDDSLIEQQDGIQSAIAHCKRSFNRGNEELATERAGSLPMLTRSRSDPGDGRSAEVSKNA